MTRKGIVMVARGLGLMIGGVSLLGGSLAIVLSACGGGDSETHGFTFDGGVPKQDASLDHGDDDDDDDDSSMDATTGDGGARDGASADASISDGAGAGGDSGGGIDGGKTDSGGGSTDAGKTDSGPPADAAPPQGLNCNGTVSPGEYGDAAHAYTNDSTGQTWYMTWDAKNLYLAITNATISEGAVFYLSNSGGGLSVGPTFDMVTPSQLPFAANAVAYFNSGDAEYRLATGGAWSAKMTDATSYKVCTSGSTREAVIPWADLAAGSGGTLPAGFQFMGYLASSTGYVYGEIPKEDPGGLDAGGAAWTHAFNVASSADGGDTPFDSPH